MENQEKQPPVVVDERVPGQSRSRQNTRYLAILLVLAVGMFGFAFANAEFFVTICRRVGLLAESPTALRGDASGQKIGRPVDVYFSATTADNLPIVFTVKNRMQKTHIGERMINDYRFVNTSGETIYFKPVHDVYPMAAGAEDSLILEACFCFTQQKIGPFETLNMPVIYTFTDKVESDVEVLKMAYTLHLSDKASYEAAQAAYKAGTQDALNVRNGGAK
ncbi:hypothetical protein GC173_01925 [bacterium]|nr:hypothetical protein [bacterium]